METICIHGSALRHCVADPDFKVFITNSTGASIDNLTYQKIAERAASEPVYFNELDCYYWMFDFMVWDFWCEATEIDLGNGCIDINIYKAPSYLS